MIKFKKNSINIALFILILTAGSLIVGPVFSQLPYSQGDKVIKGRLIGAFPLKLEDPDDTSRPGGFAGPVSLRSLNGTLHILNLPEFKVQKFDGSNDRGLYSVAKLPFVKSGGKLKSLPLDMDFDENGFLWVLDTRARLLLKFDYKGRVLKSMDLSKKCRMPLKFSCLLNNRFLIRDVRAEKVYLIDEKGSVLARLPGVCTETSIDNKSALAFGFPKLRTRLSLYTISFKTSNITPLTVIKTPLPVINAMAIGSDDQGRAYIYTVMGEYEDLADRAMVYVIKNRTLLGSCRVPYSPGYGTNRFICVSGSGKVVMNTVVNGVYQAQEYTIPLKQY